MSDDTMDRFTYGPDSLLPDPGRSGLWPQEKRDWVEARERELMSAGVDWDEDGIVAEYERLHSAVVPQGAEQDEEWKEGKAS